MKKIISKITLQIVILTLSLVIGSCASVNTESNASYKTITMSAAAKRIKEEKDFILLDVRTKEEYSAGFIPRAILLPLSEINKETVSILPRKDQLIMVYCRSGNRSRTAAAKLVELGYTNVINIGGINSWDGEISTP